MTTPAIPLNEFDQEMASTRRLLERVPSDKAQWKPHPKSFALGHLAQLVAWIPGWITRTLREPSINLLAGPGYSFEPTEAILAEFDKNVRAAPQHLEHDFAVQGRGNGYHNGVGLLPVEHLPVVGVGGDAESAARALGCGLVGVAYACKSRLLRAFEVVQYAQVVAPHCTRADHGYAQDRGLSLFDYRGLWVGHKLGIGPVKGRLRLL